MASHDSRPSWGTARIGGRMAGLALLAALPAAHAITYSDLQLSTLSTNSASASFTSAGTVMTVAETSTATMRGSSLFGYEGLWLGSDGTGGRYTFSFNTPINSISFSFIALTAFAGGPVETLTGFTAAVSTTSQLSANDGTTTWNGTVLTPVEEDSYGLLRFNAAPGASFNSIRFDHVQPAQLQGFVVERIDITAAPVPEPRTALLMTLGVLGLWRLRRTLPL
jgi:hypothetical protein